MTGRPVSPQPDHNSHVMAIALTGRLADQGDSRPLTPARFWDVYEALETDLPTVSTCADDELRRLARRSTAAALHAAELEAQGIRLITPFHHDYPIRYLDRLGNNAPPLLYVAGDTSRLAEQGRSRLAVVGSRDAEDEDLESARAAAEAATRRGWDVVSGGAKGVDSVALNTAADAGGSVIAVLSEGVRRAMRRGALRRLVSDGRAVLVAPVHPDAGFVVGNAMARNKLIYGLADLTYVAAVREGGGGTWNGATEAMLRGYGTVAVNARSDAGQAIQTRGGLLVDTVEELFEPGFADKRAGAAPEPHKATQGALFD